MKSGWQTELNAQFYRETEIVSLLLRATSWAAGSRAADAGASWEIGLAAKAGSGIADQVAGIDDRYRRARPCRACGDKACRSVAGRSAGARIRFVMALRRIEFESGRMIQAQIMFLKGPDLLPFATPSMRRSSSATPQVRELWDAMLAGHRRQLTQPG